MTAQPRFYRIIAALVEGVLRLRAELGTNETLRHRLMLKDLPAPADIWLHGASVGELASAHEIIAALSQSHSVLITSNTVTGRDSVRRSGLRAKLAPLDTPVALRAFLDHVRPRLMVSVEGEFWPLRSSELARRGIAQAMIGARMSERSARRWRRLPAIIRPILRRLSAASAQDEASETRLLSLGLPPAMLLHRLNLKLLAPVRITPPQDSRSRSLTVLAASTHEGEDELLVDAWQFARVSTPQLRLILAPRHPERGDQIAGMLRARGVRFSRRSEGADAAPVLLADTLGEMPKWYAQAGICVIGGTFNDRGGHTPWEPAAWRCAILSGPSVGNHAEGFAHLSAAGGAESVSADNLRQTLADLIARPDRAREMGDTARRILEAQAGDPAQLVAKLRSLANSPMRTDI